MYLQSLAIRRKLFDDIVSGKKNATIRTGKRKVSVGPLMMYVANEKTSGDVFTLVDVTSVVYTKFGALTHADALVNGYNDLKEMKTSLLAVYPDLTAGDDVTMITFKTPKHELDFHIQTRDEVAINDFAYNNPFVARGIKKAVESEEYFDMIARAIIRTCNKPFPDDDVKEIARIYMANIGLDGDHEETVDYQHLDQAIEEFMEGKDNE